MTNKKNDKKATETAYDDFPYESYPFPHARPELIKTNGTLFGMQPPALETARILELGCAAGGNIINFAENYPKSYTLGVDLSKVEVEHGKAIIKELGLKNIELTHQSITELDESMEKFDYIICHGVFSWVPESVREKILSVSKKLLKPNGIAFISYNTLPGWNMINTMRDMMLFHAGIFEETTSKLNQAKLFLKFINEALEDVDNPYSNFLKEETKQLVHREDSYLRHEYLAENNVQFYFQDFIKAAQAKGLGYLGEANLHSMYLGNMPERAVKELQVLNDIVRTEQYMDFIQNRRFRCTLLTHDDIKLNRNITPEHIKSFYATCAIVAEKPEKDTDLKNPLETVKFFLKGSNNEISISTSSPAMKALFYTFIENEGNPTKVEEILKLANKKLPSTKLEELTQEFDNISGKLVFTGYMKLFESRPKAVAKISSKPKVSELVRYQIKHLILNKPWITTQVNEVFILQPHEKYVLEKLDGKHSLDQIADYVLENFENGSIVASEGDKTVNEKAALKHLSKQCVELALERFRTNYILIG